MAEEVRIERPELSESDGGRRLSCIVRAGRESERLWFETSAGPLTDGIEPFIAAGLFPAMRLGLPLRSDVPACPRLLNALQTFQDVLVCWEPSFRKVPVEIPATASPPPVPAGRAVACMFSCGVDSFYSALKHRADIDVLLFNSGYEPRLSDPQTRTNALALVRSAAAELGKPLVEIDNNLVPFMSRYAVFHLHYNGAFLAAAALASAPVIARALIPASWPYAELSPGGTHLLTDPLWSTGAVEIIHDGCESSRYRKTLANSASETFLRHLRVCFESSRATPNCGRCMKCLLTMAHLRGAGVLDRCTTFDAPLDLNRLAELELAPILLSGRRELLTHLETDGRDPSLADAIRRLLAKNEPGAAERARIDELNRQIANLERHYGQLRFRLADRAHQFLSSIPGLPHMLKALLGGRRE